METPFISASWRVGHRSVTMTIETPPQRGGCINTAAEWFPDMPTRLNRHEQRQYLKGRHKFMVDLSKRAGGTVAVVDV